MQDTVTKRQFPAKIGPCRPCYAGRTEVADTSLEFDTGTKARLDAAAGIADYWVVDLASRTVIVFRDPRGGRYETRSTFRDHATIGPLALPTARLLPADLFPA